MVLAGLAGLLALAGCGNKDAGQSAGAPATPTTGAAKPVAADPATLGPDGFGTIKLGASPADVRAAGLDVVESIQGDKACPKVANIVRPGEKFADILISTRNGVSVIGAAGDMHTPEGVKVGSPLTEVRKAYPRLANSTHDPHYGGVNTTPVPGNPDAEYRVFMIDGKVYQLDLLLTANDCNI
jgi:hypothetical protein